MGKVGFYIFFALNWTITLLPLRVLYLFSDLLYLILYYFPSYRRKVVEENLNNSFPDKSEKERRVIAKKFYRHLADLFIEILKLTHMSNKELTRRMSVANPELLEDLYNSGHDLAAVVSHFNNWEWLGVSIPLQTKFNTVSIYKPVQNSMFNSFLNGLRSRNNAGLVPMNQIVRKIIGNKQNNIRTLYGFLSDQTPARPYIKYYTEFLNQETPVFLGIENIALKYDMPVIFANVEKVKRGYYRTTIELLFKSTNGLPEHYVTETHVRKLEELIRKNPEYWIWTHRRWKYKKEA